MVTDSRLLRPSIETLSRSAETFKTWSSHALSRMLLLASLAWLSLWPSPVVGAEDRIALILAVENYSHFQKAAVTNDTASKMHDVLKKRGFDVSIALDANNASARAALREFASKVEGANAAIIILAGHGVSAAGRSYLLPSNVEIGRDSDLLSRGLVLPNVARIVERAKSGGVFFFASAANLPATLQAVSARPKLTEAPPTSVVVALSTSDKVPISRVDAVTARAAADFLEALGESPLLMANLASAVAAGGVGQIFGTPPETDLAQPPTPPPTEALSSSAATEEATAREAAARRDAEQRARDAEERARRAEQRARETEARAKAEARDAEARAREAEKKAQEIAQKEREADAASTPAGGVAPSPSPQEPDSDVESLRIVEALFGRSKRKEIQFLLRKKGLYEGQVDAIFGPLTRVAIKDFQKSLGADETGYLTPQQLQRLIGE